MILKDRLERVEERIHAAADRAGRRREDVALMAVTKKFSAEAIREAYDLGLRVFGENYVQEFEAKHPALSGPRRRGVSSHRPSSVQQGPRRRGSVPGDPDRRFRETGPAS